MQSSIAATGQYDVGFPSWGRCFWQDPNDGALFLAYASGNSEVDFIYSTNNGIDWSTPERLFPIDDFSVDNNFDIAMDPQGHVHSVFKYNGSGCYQFTGKLRDGSGGWTTSSGVGPAGFCLTTDGASSSPGLHAHIYTDQGPVGIFGDIAIQHPAARIACKKADQEIELWYVTDPFTSYPVMQSGVSRPGIQAGPFGGYPVLSNAGFFNTLKLAYSASGVLIRTKDYGSSSYNEELPIVPTAHYTDSGASGIIPFGPQMAAISGFVGTLNPIMVSHASGYEMYVAMNESNGQGNVFRRVDSSADLVSFTANQRRAPNGIPLFVAGPSGDIYGLDGGTYIDMSHTDTQDALHIYFMGRDHLGIYGIGRVLCRMQREHSSGGPTQPAQATEFEFSSISHFVSGVRNIAPATHIHTGGNDGVAHWKTFKAVRHPAMPGEGVEKKELVATIGSEPVYPSGFNIVIWNYNDSVAATQSFHYPVYEMEYTSTSGDANPAFAGVYRTLRVTNPHRAFDRNDLTDALLGSGSSMTIEFVRPLMFTRIELETFAVTSSNRFPGARISGSIDGENWNYLHTMSSGYNTSQITLSANNPTPFTAEESINPWVAKYLKFDWQQSQKKATNHALTEMRIFGPGQTKGELTYLNIVNPSYDVIRPEGSRSTERFDRTTEGNLPSADWRTYGNFIWGVRASGSWSRTSSSSLVPYPQDGIVHSGIFENDSNGNGDGFSLKPNDCVPPNTSGIVEFDVTVYEGEYSSSGVVDQRTFSFDYRVDFPGTDDRCDVYVATQGSSSPGTLIRRITQPNADWQTASFDVGYGDWTIRWIFTRGATETTNSTIGQIWIDNVVGINGPPQPSIGGFINGEQFVESGVIHGYMNAKGAWEIHGYISGAPLYETIHGYINAVPTESGAIHGYINSSFSESIHGFMIGAGTEVNSSIYGLIGGQPSGTPTSSINAFMFGEGDHNRIHGFIMGQSGVGSSIHGYMDGVNLTSSIYGYMFARGIESGSIHGYMIAQMPYSTIYGFIGTSGGAVASGPGQPSDSSTSGVEPTNWINGFIRGEEPYQIIHGYIHGPPGGTSQIHGYLAAGASENTIHGYMRGMLEGSGSIHGFMDAIGFSSGSIHGFVYGIDDIVDSQIYGYIVGVMNPSGNIYGFMIGVPQETNSADACLGHGTIPLPSETPAVIPSSSFNYG